MWLWSPSLGGRSSDNNRNLQIGLVQRFPLLLRLAGKLKKQRPRYGARETLVGPVAGEERGWEIAYAMQRKLEYGVYLKGGYWEEERDR